MFSMLPVALSLLSCGATVKSPNEQTSNPLFAASLLYVPKDSPSELTAFSLADGKSTRVIKTNRPILNISNYGIGLLLVCGTIKQGSNGCEIELLRLDEHWAIIPQAKLITQIVGWQSGDKPLFSVASRGSTMAWVSPERTSLVVQPGAPVSGRTVKIQSESFAFGQSGKGKPMIPFQIESIAVSPSGSLVAYVQNTPGPGNALRILEVKTGRIQHFDELGVVSDLRWFSASRDGLMVSTFQVYEKATVLHVLSSATEAKPIVSDKMVVSDHIESMSRGITDNDIHVLTCSEKKCTLIGFKAAKGKRTVETGRTTLLGYTYVSRIVEGARGDEFVVDLGSNGSTRLGKITSDGLVPFTGNLPRLNTNVAPIWTPNSFR